MQGTQTFKMTSVDFSFCSTDGDSNDNTGFGSGLIDGSSPATVIWDFVDSPDNDTAEIDLFPDAGVAVLIGAAPPAPLNGAPGGVWAFGDLPWPASGGD